MIGWRKEIAARIAGLLPAQGGKSGEYLTTDGSDLSWAAGGSSDGTAIHDDDVPAANGPKRSTASASTTPRAWNERASSRSASGGATSFSGKRRNGR